MDPRIHLALAINRLPGYRGQPKRRLFDSCRYEKDLADAINSYFQSMKRPPRSAKPLASELLTIAENELRRLTRYSIGLRLLGDSDYPEGLSEIHDPPFILYHRGNPDSSAYSPVAIVGTRRPSIEGSRQAYRLALEFSMAGYPVVSGLAFGIDRAAHEGALDGFGCTWAVLAGGLDRPSPYSHRSLASRILDRGGVLLGEMPPGNFPEKYAFPRRNRILSGLCRGCIVVQAPERSGALITADFALSQGRDLYIGSTGLEGMASGGTRELEIQGAPVVYGASDVLADWGRFLSIPSLKPISPPESPETLSRLMNDELTGRAFRYMGGWFEYRGA